jgi:death-on-curing protein
VSEHLTLVEVLAIHDDQILRYGGAPGIRDPGQLEAALYRAQSGYYPDVIEEAAALWESLSQNHPFIDGNKRTAFAATYTFLVINGWSLTEGAEGTAEFIEGLYATHTFTFAVLAAWLRMHCQPTTPQG